MDELYGELYFIEAVGTGLVKIGISSVGRGGAERRLATLQTGSANELRLVAHQTVERKMEKWYHRRFFKYRQRGEWFRFVGELRDFVTALANLRCGERLVLDDDGVRVEAASYYPTGQAAMDALARGMLKFAREGG